MAKRNRHSGEETNANGNAPPPDGADPITEEVRTAAVEALRNLVALNKHLGPLCEKTYGGMPAEPDGLAIGVDDADIPNLPIPVLVAKINAHACHALNTAELICGAL